MIYNPRKESSYSGDIHDIVLTSRSPCISGGFPSLQSLAIHPERRQSIFKITIELFAPTLRTRK
jgi:hypothetical protein